MQERNVINENVRQALGPYKGQDYQTFSGPGIQAVMYMPLMTINSAKRTDPQKIKVFADLQTITISSTRSISPVRVFGRSNPICFTKGAITYAGSMVFATLNKDAFSDIYDTDLAESYLNTSSSIIAHQLPPFSIVLTSTNETGGVCIQAINNIVITNYGTVHSIEDLYNETSFTYIATDVTPLIPVNNSLVQKATIEDVQRFGKNASTAVLEVLEQAYGTTVDSYQRMLRLTDNTETL